MYHASILYKNDETLPKNWKIHHLGILEYQIFHLSMYQASILYKNDETLPKNWIIHHLKKLFFESLI